MPKEQLDITIILKAEKAAKELQNFAKSMKKNGKVAAKSWNVVNDKITRVRKSLLSMKTLIAGGIGVFAIQKLGKSFIRAGEG